MRKGEKSRLNRSPDREEGRGRGRDGNLIIKAQAPYILVYRESKVNPSTCAQAHLGTQATLEGPTKL